MDPEYLTQLNQQQRDAVEYVDGPSLVIAGAGSGKTRVLTYKIVHLLVNGYEPYRILALTFTNKAAREMRERIEQLVGQQTASRLWMGTFHSIFARILRQNADRIGYKRDFTIYDASDSRSLIKTIIKDMNLDDKVYKPATVQSAISSAKNALISPDQYAADPDLTEADRRSKRPLTAAIYRTYRHRCFVAGAMDFDDLLYYTNVLLRDNPDLLRHYQEFFRYILVDEYQDTNFAQHLIVSQLAAESKQLCVVGDDAQSIYSFRGANIRNILNLKKSYPELRVFKLERNYRSTQNIINAANSLIDKNTEQIRKQVFSLNQVGEPIEVVNSFSDYEEAFLVANRISQLKMQGAKSYEDFAILYRTNAQSRILEESLRKRNIPYRIYGGLSFYQRKEIKDAIAYFRLAINPTDDEALKRVINFPARGIGDTTLNKLFRAAIDHNVSVWEVICDPVTHNLEANAGTMRRLDSFRLLIEEFRQLNASGADAEQLARTVIQRTGLLTMLINDRTPESISKQENLNELLSATREYVDTAAEEGLDDHKSLSDFLAEISLATDQDSDTATDTDERITLMTAHAAKGLEFSNVFIVGVEEDLFPSAMACSSQSEVEEERRLLYVAITRAKEFCMISYASSRFHNGQTKTCSPSRFIRDIDRKYLRLMTGTSLSGHTTNPVETYRQSFHSQPQTRRAFGYKEPQRPSNSPNYDRPWIRGGVNASPAAAQPATSAAAAAPSGLATHSAAELAEGMRIEHQRFGVGRIMDINTSTPDVRIVVQFDNVDTKTLLLKFAKFKILSQQ